MTVSIFCFVLFLSLVLSDRPMNVQVAEYHQCSINVSDSSIKLFNKSLEDGKKVIFFRIHYDSKQADALTTSKPDDHFANANEYMWLYDGEHGLKIYMNAPYDFDLLSLYILEAYTSTLTVNMNVSKSCNENMTFRVDFLRLVFQQLLQIVSTANLPDKKASAYICYDINNRKMIPDDSFMAYKRLGINREVLLRYCCEVKDSQTDYYDPVNLCSGTEKGMSTIIDFLNYIGAFLFAFSPLAIGFIMKAKLPGSNERFSYICLISPEFHDGDQFVFPSGTESSWISERDNPYNALTFFKWCISYNKPFFSYSRSRRMCAVIWFTTIVCSDASWHSALFPKHLRTYLDNNVPLGYLSIFFGFNESAKNTDYFLGGPLVWLSAFTFLGQLVINIPDRLCQTIAYSTLHQQETFTFLVQDITLLQRYGSLKISNLQDYDLLRAILKSSLLTALNPLFWFAVCERWIDRYKRVFNYFNNPRAIYKLIGRCVTLLCGSICLVLCACELLLCIVYYGCPQLLIWKAIPHSYFQKYITPLFRNTVWRQISGYLLLTIFLPCCLFLFLFSAYTFITSFSILCGYVGFTVIAVFAKPHALESVLIIVAFSHFVVSIFKSVSENYRSLLKMSIKLTASVDRDFVHKRLDESFIHAELFERIVERHHPIRYEFAKVVLKLVFVFWFLFYSLIFQYINLNISTLIKIGLMILTSLIPNVTTFLRETVPESRWKIEDILETIYIFSRERVQVTL